MNDYLSSYISHSNRLSSGERFAVALELLYPWALALLIYRFLEHAFLVRVIGTVIPTLAYALFWFFVLAPWTVRRVFAVRRPTFEFAVVRRDGTESGHMRYMESLRVTWLLSWRTILVLLALFAVVLLGLRLGLQNAGAVGVLLAALLFAQFVSREGFPESGGLSSDWTFDAALLVGWVGLAGIWLVGAAVRKQYTGFSIRIGRTESVASGFSVDAARGDQLTIPERFRLGSVIVGPLFCLNACFGILLGSPILHFPASSLWILAVLNLAIALFAVLPWAIRRGVCFEFQSFHLVVVRPESEREARDLGYGESLKLSLLVAFGTVGIAAVPFLAAALVASKTPAYAGFVLVVGMWLGAAVLTGEFLVRNAYSAFSLHNRRLE